MAILVIRRFDVFRNPDPDTRTRAPYVVVLQSHHWRALDTTIVAPLFPRDRYPPDGLIVLSAEVEDEDCSLDLALLANLQSHALRQRVGSLAPMEDEIRRGLERLFTGF